MSIIFLETGSRPRWGCTFAPWVELRTVSIFSLSHENGSYLLIDKGAGFISLIPVHYWQHPCVIAMSRCTGNCEWWPDWFPLSGSEGSSHRENTCLWLSLASVTERGDTYFQQCAKWTCWSKYYLHIFAYIHKLLMLSDFVLESSSCSG